jgi:FtsZ-interacting cell division protein ZipA
MKNQTSNKGSISYLPLYIVLSVICSIIIVVISLFCAWKKSCSKKKVYLNQNSSNVTQNAEGNESQQRVINNGITNDGLIESSKTSSISSKTEAQETTPLRNDLNEAKRRSPNLPTYTEEDNAIYDVPPSRMRPNITVNNQQLSDHLESDPIYDSPRK